MGLEDYRRKRRFEHTSEPAGGITAAAEARTFVVQKHAARRLHYDFRLELGGTLKSWAVPKGPSLDPDEKRLAVHVEDHPLEYAEFEGTIPKGEYGGGTVLVWDRGLWVPQGDAEADYRKGHLRFLLIGEKLHGGWSLVRTGQGGPGKEQWLLVKHRDAWAGREADLLDEAPRSVATGRTLEEVGAARPADLRPYHGPAAFPAAVLPQLATLVTRPPAGERWLHEIKYDGYRVLSRLADGQARLYTRGGKDWTARFASLARALQHLPVRQAWLDGEVAVLLPDGRSSFSALQAALSAGRDHELVYLLFDLIHLDAVDLGAQPLERRKARLAELLRQAPAGGALRYSDHVRGEGEIFYRHACELGLEGVVSKRADRPYRPGRGRDWQKAKCLQRQEFVIGGFSAPGGSRAGLGALLLGVYREDGRLVYAGRVGTGFDERTLRSLRTRLEADAVAGPAFARPFAEERARDVTWVRPRWVAEVAFANWTEDGVLRHPSFQGLREDKPAREVVREVPAGGGPATVAALPAEHARRQGPVRVAGIALSNPDKVLYPGQGLTKRDLAGYYEAVAPWFLPEVSRRPLTLLRCPDGPHRSCFYQKHAPASAPPSVLRVAIPEKGRTVHYMGIHDLAGVVALVQMGVLEVHVWGARADRLDRPDRLVFDLDPDEGLNWEAVVQAAYRVRDRLAGLGLASFVRTTGGKGLHVVAPLARRHQWPVAKAFAKAVAEDIVRAEPRRYTARLAKRARSGKVFIDYLRNAPGATAIASYSTRARPGAPVAVPLSWDELAAGVRSDQYTVRNLAARLAGLRGDPWAELLQLRQSITSTMQRELGLR